MQPISGYNVAAKTGTAEVAEGSKGYGGQRIISVAEWHLRKTPSMLSR